MSLLGLPILLWRSPGLVSRSRFIDSVSLLSAGQAQSHPRHLGRKGFKECRYGGLYAKLYFPTIQRLQALVMVCLLAGARR